VTNQPTEFILDGQTLFNELHHFTANKPDGSGFAACLAPLVHVASGLKVWCKGHGTGTLEAGRLEANAFAGMFPSAPLVGWKGSLGHTLGSCGLVELAIACAAIQRGCAPGTVNTARPTFTDTVATGPLSLAEFDGVICASNAFGGAHAALLLRHA
jgi:3-oxoacyl-(acyl-carrier-protein) synthase